MHFLFFIFEQPTFLFSLIFGPFSIFLYFVDPFFYSLGPVFLYSVNPIQPHISMNILTFFFSKSAFLVLHQFKFKLLVINWSNKQKTIVIFKTVNLVYFFLNFYRSDHVGYDISISLPGERGNSTDGPFIKFIDNLKLIPHVVDVIVICKLITDPPLHIYLFITINGEMNNFRTWCFFPWQFL